MIRIIRGKNKKTKIDVPKIGVRPTSSIKKESIFSILESYSLKNNYEIYKKKYFLDLFSGSGSLGLEAISRGAEFCYFYEYSSEVIKVLKKNCIKICKNDNYEIIQEDVTQSNFTNVKNKISTIFIDPPYNLNIFTIVLKIILKKNLISKKTIIVIESEKNTIVNLPNTLKVFDERFYGKTKIMFVKKN